MNSKRISVIIPTKDDHYLLERALTKLDLDAGNAEVILVNDGSLNKIPENLYTDFPRVRVVNVGTQRGVGHAFDMGVTKARYNNIMLMGSDIIVDHGWRNHVIKNVRKYPKSFTCATCVALSEDDVSFDRKKRSYGATITSMVEGARSDILQCKWLREKESDTSYEVPAILGTCYAVSKQWYEHIGGWGWLKKQWGLNREERKWSGHRIWGGLEPMISLKSWFAGGSCRVDPTWETGHIFGRLNHIRKSRGSRMDKYYFNKLFIAYTLFSENEAKAFEKHLRRDSSKAKNDASRTIIRNKKAIELEMLYNNSIKVEDWTILKRKFGWDSGL